MFGYFVAALRLIWVIIAADPITGGPKPASLLAATAAVRH
jgi:hypothetical protein